MIGTQTLLLPYMHCIIIPPAIEVRWLDTLLTQQSGYLRTMINGVVDGLDHHDDGRSLVGSPVKIKDLNEFHVCSDGIYEFYNSYEGIMGGPFAYGPTPVLHKGIGQTYVLAVVAIRSSMTVYANYQKIAAVINSYGTHGQIGCESTSIGGVLTEAIFHNAKVWTF